MIRGIDAQVMTQRTTEYAKDVSSMLRRDELQNEFANRMNQLNTEQEARSVTQSEKALQSRINADEERDRGGQGREREQEGEEQSAFSEEQQEIFVPSIGRLSELPLLDIEV